MNNRTTAYLEGQNRARASLGVLGEFNTHRLGVGEAGVLERVYVHQVVRLGRKYHLARPVCVYSYVGVFVVGPAQTQRRRGNDEIFGRKCMCALCSILYQDTQPRRGALIGEFVPMVSSAVLNRKEQVAPGSELRLIVWVCALPGWVCALPGCA